MDKAKNVKDQVNFKINTGNTLEDDYGDEYYDEEVETSPVGNRGNKETKEE